MATYYRWKKYETIYNESSKQLTSSEQLGYEPSGQKVVKYSTSKPTISSAGKYTASNTETVTSRKAYSFDYVINPYDESICFKGVKMRIVDNYLDVWAGDFIGPDLNVKYSLSKAKGNFLNYTYDTSSAKFPNGDFSGEYYYEDRTTVTSPTAPMGLTYPNPITTPTVMVSWQAATSNTDYPVSGYHVTYGFNNVPNAFWVDSTETSVEIDIPATYNGQPVTQAYFSVYAKDSNGQNGSSASSGWVPVYLAPTLTVPQMVMQGQQATVNWTSIEGADSYTLQRKSSADADWTQVYSGANLTFSEAVGIWTTVQYRVQAVFDGTSGGWAESAAIPVVSASSLVISGTDEDLGVVTNDIPYSISTDTGNQITATITVNNAVIFSGNVGNSTADVIPVLDLITGEGTIVISATVDASGSPVTATRTWTYEKAAITFPNSGSVAQVTKEGENIYPKVLAEGVRLPGGKTLDQVMGFPCQIYAGSYVGTGTYGQSNPNTLMFPFEPKLVFISGMAGPSWAAARMLRNDAYGNIQVNTTVSTVHTSWDGNSVQWYDTTAPTNQLNMSGNTYYYIALG